MGMSESKRHINSAVWVASAINRPNECRTKAELKREIDKIASEAWVVIGYLNDACDEIGMPHYGDKS